MTPRAVRILGRALAAAALMAPAACELTESVAVDAILVPVAEVVLREGSSVQTGYLHRTGPADASGRRVPGAHVEVRPVPPAGGPALTLTAADLPFCLVFWRESFQHADGSCYAATQVGEPPRAGATYELRVALPDGGTLSGRTTLPADFRLTHPALASDTCALAPGRSLELSWTRAPGAWAYMVEANLFHLDDALAPRGIEIQDDPFFLRGVAVSADDTTFSFPGGLGLFERADLPRALLLELQEGLPAGVVAEVAVAAVDRNYVNWTRGGAFHPSGAVRIPSLRGEGTGLFGSVVERGFVAVVGDDVAHPPCGP